MARTLRRLAIPLRPASTAVARRRRAAVATPTEAAPRDAGGTRVVLTGPLHLHLGDGGPTADLLRQLAHLTGQASGSDRAARRSRGAWLNGPPRAPTAGSRTPDASTTPPTSPRARRSPRSADSDSQASAPPEEPRPFGVAELTQSVRKSVVPTCKEMILCATGFQAVALSLVSTPGLGLGIACGVGAMTLVGTVAHVAMPRSMGGVPATLRSQWRELCAGADGLVAAAARTLTGQGARAPDDAAVRSSLASPAPEADAREVERATAAARAERLWATSIALGAVGAVLLGAAVGCMMTGLGAVGMPLLIAAAALKFAAVFVGGFAFHASQRAAQREAAYGPSAADAQAAPPEGARRAGTDDVLLEGAP